MSSVLPQHPPDFQAIPHRRICSANQELLSSWRDVVKTGMPLCHRRRTRLPGLCVRTTQIIRHLQSRNSSTYLMHIQSHLTIGQQRPRYTTFFIESSCAVLLHDVLSHPSKYAYHLEYIQLATDTLESMVHDDPVLNAQRSIRRILQAVERAISAPSLPTSETNPSEPASSTANPHPTSNPSGQAFPNPYGHGTSVQFPSLQPQAHPTSEDLIYLSDRSTSAGIYGNVNAMAAQQGDGSQAAMQNPSSSGTGGPGAGAGVGAGAGGAAGVAATDAQNFFDFDVLATDLYSFFPLDLSAQGI